MLSDEQLEIISQAIQPLFQHLEQEVIRDIARRIDKTLTYTRTAELQAVALHRLGYSPAKIRREAMRILDADAEYRKIVARNTMEYKREVRRLINRITAEAYRQGNEIVRNAGDMAWVNDLSVWRAAGKDLVNTRLPELIDSLSRQTAGELKNLTRTTGFKTMSGYEPLETTYRHELDKAVIKTCSGAFTRDQVMRAVVRNLSKSGLRSIDYSSNYSMQLDTAAALAIRTGCHQLVEKITDANLEESGENLVYIGSHWGARDQGQGIANHAAWQGKVYYIKPGRDYSAEETRIGYKITDLWVSTGYSADGAHESNPLGLNGYNCRHKKHIWFPGISEFPEESPEPGPIKIGSRGYSYYEVAQEMRKQERKIRAAKREREALTSLGMDSKEIRGHIVRLTRSYREFCANAGINPRSDRLRYDSGTGDVTKTKAYKEYLELRAP